MKRLIVMIVLCIQMVMPVTVAAQGLLGSPTVIVAQQYSDLNAAIAAAVTAAGSGKATVWIAVSSSTTGSVTVDAKINFEFSGTGAIVLGAGHTVTYNGSTVGWPLRQLFSGSGSFVFGAQASGASVAQWWGGAANGTNNFTTPLRAAVAAMAGSSGVKTLALSGGIFLVNYETVNSAWVGISTGIHVKGDGYSTEIRGNAASLGEGENGTLLAIEGSNVTVEGVRINGNKGAVSGLTSYGSVGVRIATAATNVVISRYVIHDLPASAATEARGVLMNTSGAVSNVRLTHGETYGINGTGVDVNGDYEQAGNTSQVMIEDLYTHDNSWHGMKISGARDVRVSDVRSDNNTLDCLSVEFALRVRIAGELSRCRNGLFVKGDSDDIQTDARLWGSNKSGTSQAQVALGVATWGGGQNTKAVPRQVDIRNATIQPTPGGYHVWIEHDATVSTYNDTGTFSVASNVITRSAGTWAAGILAGHIVNLSGFTTANNIAVRVLSRTSTQLTIDPLYSVLVDDTGTGNEAVASTFESVPVRLLANEALTYRVENFAGTAVTTGVSPVLKQSTLNESVISSLPPFYWLQNATLTAAAFSGTGQQSPDAITLTGTANTAALVSSSLLDPYGTYVLRVRYKPTATGKTHDWRLRAVDGSVLSSELLLTGDSTLLTTQWREADVRVQVGATAAWVQFVLLTGSVTSTLDVDWVTITRLPSAATRAGTVTRTLTFQGWLTQAAQTLDLGVLPAHCLVTDVRIVVKQTFDSSGTDIVTVGYTGNTSVYAGDVDVEPVNSFYTPVGIVDTVARDLKAYYVNGGGEPTQGKALVVVRCDQTTVQP